MNIAQALHDPAATFQHPSDVLTCQALTRLEKIQALRRWEYEQRGLAVAIEENMPSTELDSDTDLLAQIVQALHSLGETATTDSGSVTKHGGA